MTIEPVHYVVKPSKAILDQKQSVTVAIKLLPIKDLATFKVARQKFLIESVLVDSSTTLDMVNEKVDPRTKQNACPFNTKQLFTV